MNIYTYTDQLLSYGAYALWFPRPEIADKNIEATMDFDSSRFWGLGSWGAKGGQ